MPIKLVALDIGGILATIDKLPLQTLLRKNRCLHKNFFDDDFTRLQRGDIDTHGFLIKKSHCFGIDADILRNAFASMLVATAQEILPKINVDYFFMSNINEIHFDSFLAQVKVSSFSMNNSCLSFQNGHLKPEAAFFKLAADLVNTPPANILFIDDKSENIRSAAYENFTTEHCVHPKDLTNILRRHRLI